jgi:hypothetical protein
MILMDTGPIVALFDSSDNYHKLCLETLKKVKEPLTTTWPVLTEAFFLLGFSWKAQDNLWEFIQRGGLGLVDLDSRMQERCRQLMAKYKDLPMDLADSSLVAVAETNNIQRVFTLDHKDFAIYRLDDRRGFHMMPSHL